MGSGWWDGGILLFVKNVQIMHGNATDAWVEKDGANKLDAKKKQALQILFCPHFQKKLKSYFLAEMDALGPC